MASQSVVPKKKRGPVPTGKGESTNVRLHPDLQGALDEWIKALPAPKPSRPEAIRIIVAEFLGLKPEKVLSIEDKIADTKRRLAEAQVPSEPSPERGMALLRKGSDETKLRNLKARQPPKVGR